MKRCIVFWNEEDQEKLLSWWTKLKENHGCRAELRRTEKPEDVLLTKGFRSLYYELAGTYWIREKNLLGLAAVAGVLSHVEGNNTTHSFAESCAIPEKDKPAVSEMRFSQLQKSRTLDELFTRMRRAIRLLSKKANVISVTDSILHWYTEMVKHKVEEEPRNRINVRWGLEYFQNLPRTEVK